MRRVRGSPFGAGIIAATLVAACQSPPASLPAAQKAGDSCAARAILSFTEDAGAQPDERFVTDLARASDVHLTFLRLAGPNLYVFSLSAAHSDPGCEAAFARLRSLKTVRFAEPDERRRAHG